MSNVTADVEWAQLGRENLQVQDNLQKLGLDVLKTANPQVDVAEQALRAHELWVEKYTGLQVDYKQEVANDFKLLQE